MTERIEDDDREEYRKRIRKIMDENRDVFDALD